MKKLLFGIVAATVLLGGCSKNDDDMGGVKDEKVYTEMGAALPSTSRTTLDGMKVIWSANDAVSVWSDTHNTPAKFTIFDGVGATTAKFQVPEGAEGVRGNNFYAVYPYTSNGEISLPSSQAYSADENFPTNLFPMAAVGTDLSQMSFKNLCGIMVVELYGDEGGQRISRLELSTSGSQTLWGTGTVDFTGETPKINWTSYGTTLTYTCGTTLSTDSANPNRFYIVVPAGSYDNMRITAYISSSFDAVLTKTRTTSITVPAGSVTSMGAKFLINTKTYAVGDAYPSDSNPQGIVFSTTDEGRSGLVVALKDCVGNDSFGQQASGDLGDYWAFNWGPSTVPGIALSLTNANDGLANTELALNNSAYPAFAAIKAYREETANTNWYLPASNEMSVLMNVIGGLDFEVEGREYPAADGYWCSNYTGTRKVIYYYDCVNGELSTIAPTKQSTVSNGVRAIMQF